MQKKNHLLIFLAFMIYAMAYSEDPSSKCPLKNISQGVNLRDLVSRADLVYDKPAIRSEAGMPVGNGRMGSLVWTTPTAMKMQINRVDVFGANKATNSFKRRTNNTIHALTIAKEI